MGKSRSYMVIGRASGGAGTSSRAWGPSMQPLAPEVFLSTSGPLRPPSDEQWGTPEIDRTLRVANGKTGMVSRDAQHEEASIPACECSHPSCHKPQTPTSSIAAPSSSGRVHEAAVANLAFGERLVGAAGALSILPALGRRSVGVAGALSTPSRRCRYPVDAQL